MMDVEANTVHMNHKIGSSDHCAPVSGYNARRPMKMKENITMADIINRRMIPQPPTRKEVQQRLNRKNHKLLKIDELIIIEEKKIQETTEYLDRYFDALVEFHKMDNLKGIFPKSQQPMNGCLFTIYELHRIFEVHGIYFYVSLSKTIAIFEIMRMLSNKIKDKQKRQEMIEQIKSSNYFTRLLAALRRHGKMATRLHIPLHLINEEEFQKHTPQLSNADILSVVTSLSYFMIVNEIDCLWLLNIILKRCEQFEISDLALIITCHKIWKYKINQHLPDFTKLLMKRIDEFVKLPINLQTNVLKTFSKCQYVDRDFITKWAENIKQSDDLTPEVAFKVYLQLPLLEYLDEELYKILYQTMMKDLNTIPINLEGINYFMLSLSKCHVPAPVEIFDHVSNNILKGINGFTLNFISRAINIMATFGYYNQQLLQVYFGLDILQNPPSQAQLEYFIPQEKQIYSAYTGNEMTSLPFSIAMAYSTYVGFKVESQFASRVTIPNQALKNMEGFFLIQNGSRRASSYAYILEIKQLLKEEFNIDAKIFYNDPPQSLVVDVALVPSSLSNVIDNVELIKDKKLGIMYNGPYKYIQACIKDEIPPLDQCSQYIKRIMTKMNWDIIDIPYWEFVPWMPRKKKARLLYNKFPDWIKNVVKPPSDS
ncbi:RAP domain [Babesia duncani]|uniref:RAP domain n=1 Tax=Babesia duncani TaxID=323732 RepID=A0AAD9PKK5_9APIC|nr:RAP domain [Babesia duncani]KAK2196533.1 RAP domain [Babesia duncani]